MTVSDKRKAQMRKYYHNNKEKLKEYYLENKEKRNLQMKEWYQDNKRQKKDRQMKWLYGVGVDWFESNKEMQDGACQVCGELEATDLDHCHDSKKPRAPLCRTCNLMLGYAKDNPDLLRAGADYLEDHSVG